MKAKPNYLPAEQRRVVTVEAIISLAAERNPSEITTGEIAERMNLTQGALFRHFRTKDAMWHTVMAWVAEQLLARIDEAARRATSPLSAVEAMFMTHLDFVSEHPGVPRILFGELQRAKDTATKRLVRTLLTHYSQRLHRLLEQAKNQGEVSAEVDVKAAATVFLGLIQGLIMQGLVVGKSPAPGGAAVGTFAIFVRGVRKVP